MPIPAFTIDGILPPYIGSSGPGGPQHLMSPYVATATEFVATLGLTEARKEILRGWLGHRKALRAIGFDQGFQWLDGSFVESKNPRDLDVVTFLRRPSGIQGPGALRGLMQANLSVFDRGLVKTTYNLDHFLIDLDGTAEAIVNLTRYYLGLFSHRRVDQLWKGMLQIGLGNPADDLAAIATLVPAAASAGAIGANP